MSRDHSTIARGYKPVASDSISRLLVSVVIPAKDEGRSIGSLMPNIRETLSGYTHEIIVVDDGSSDETREIARINGAVVVSHEKNLGKGAAMKTGVRTAGGDIIVFLDGDGAHDPADIPTVIAPIFQSEADLVIGSRALPNSKVVTPPLIRRLSNDLASVAISLVISFLLPASRVLSRLTRLRKLAKTSQGGQATRLRWIRISDCTSGFRAIGREAWAKLNLTSAGFEIEAEMIYEAAKNNLAIAEAPISCDWDSRLSHLSVLQDGSKTLRLLVMKLLGDVAG